MGPMDVVFSRATSGRSQLQADRLDLAPIAGLADALPLEASLRTRLVEAAPRGRVEDLRLAWDSGSKRPEQFEVEGRFIGLAMAGSGSLPGVSGLSGRIQSDRNGGKLEIDAGAVAVSWPAQFTEPLAVDWIKGLLSWTYPEGRPLFQLQRLALANADLAASASGSLSRRRERTGHHRSQGGDQPRSVPAIPKYAPLALGPQTRKWLSTAFEAGSAKDGKMHLQGNLADFPFDKPNQTGIFEVTANAQGVQLRFAPDWPTVDGIDGTFSIRGSRLEVIATGSIAGVTLDRTSAVIPVLSPHEPMLEIKGGAQGPTQDFLALHRCEPGRPHDRRVHQGHAGPGQRAAGNGSAHPARPRPGSGDLGQLPVRGQPRRRECGHARARQPERDDQLHPGRCEGRQRDGERLRHCPHASASPPSRAVS